VEAFQVSVGVSVVTVGPGNELPPGDKPVGVGGAVEPVFTVSVVEPVVPPIFALMLDVPDVTPVARPPGAIVATLVLLELQATKGVRSSVLLFLRLPVAINCNVFPTGTVGLAGVTVIEVRPVSLPVPLSGTRVGLPAALLLIARVPVRIPIAIGTKVTATVHESPAPMLEPQVLLATVKSPLADMEAPA
jgi:hypothetical protein